MDTAYMNRMLWIDLTSGKSYEKDLSEELRTNYLGGKGFGIQLLYDAFPKGDALDERNPLIFVTGPLTGTLAPSMRACIVSKSPLTGTYCDSYFGGHFGQEIKYAGYDVVGIVGRSEEPAYIFIVDDRVEIRDAKRLWGMETESVYRGVKKELGDPTVKVACIGPAGERRVRFAMIDCEYHHQAGRGGLGAVMGSKNLKAVAVKGTRLVNVFDKAYFAKAVREAFESLERSEARAGFTRGGTAGVCFEFSNTMGFLPVRNFTDGVVSEELVRKVEITQHQKKLWLRDTACAGCPIRCSKVGRIRQGPHKGSICENIEYETLGIMAANLEWGDLNGIAYANRLCDNLGMDTISTGVLVGFAIEASNKGILTKKDLDGLDLSFGKSESIIELIRRIAYREGIGDVLAEGVKLASEKFGKGSTEFAVHIKALEPPAWGPRGSTGMGLAYMTADRGMCHQRSYPIAWEASGTWPGGGELKPLSLEHKGELVAWEQNLVAACYSLVLCAIARSGMTTEISLNLLRGAIGVELTEKEFLKIGERIWNLIRVYNNGNGFTRKDDYLSPRFSEPLPSGPYKGHFFSLEDQDRLLDDYYRVRGWDRDGRPAEKKLRELGLKNE